MADTVIKKLNEKISKLPKGKILFIKDFTTFGNDVVIRQSLKRLVEKKRLIRIAQGIYYKPKESKILGIVYPAPEKVAEAIAKRDKARIILTGSYALYQLGLSQQIPMNIVYLTDGSARVINIGKQKITFKKTAPKNFSVEHKLSSMLIQGLKALGEKNIDATEKIKIKQIIVKSKEANIIEKGINDAPVWIQKIIKGILREIKNEKLA